MRNPSLGGISPYQWGRFSGARGGSIEGGQDPAGTQPGPYIQLAAWTGDEPIPIVVSTEVKRFSGNRAIGARFYVAPTGGTTLWNDLNLQGSCLIEYGVGGLTRRREIDLQDGTFQLPPCTSVRVYGRFYNTSALGPGLRATFSASIAPGIAQVPSWATYSGLVSLGAGTVSGVSFDAPVGCYGWRVGANPSGVVPGVDFQLSVDGGQPQLYLDYALPSQVPGIGDLAFTNVGLSMRKTGAAIGSVIVNALVGF